ncbi:MAG: P1 family peptidase, partial [Anaerolineales bacterium]|nr:P1 family peptidase [Anaerolineales bacterium]
FQALDSAAGGPIEEGNVGGGTGMICHEFKGGIGTASRLVQTPTNPYTLGALVQANYGDRLLLRIDGVPVGRMVGTEAPALPWVEPPISSSIIVVIATNAPLVPIQCQRLARRATIGLARAGGYGANSSGDIFLAFATGNPIPCNPKEAIPLQMLPNEHISPLFEAAAEAVEEAILNALVAAETMTGYKQRTAYELPLERVAEIFRGRG